MQPNTLWKGKRSTTAVGVRHVLQKSTFSTPILMTFRSEEQHGTLHEDKRRRINPKTKKFIQQIYKDGIRKPKKIFEAIDGRGYEVSRCRKVYPW